MNTPTHAPRGHPLDEFVTVDPGLLFQPDHVKMPRMGVAVVWMWRQGHPAVSQLGVVPRGHFRSTALKAPGFLQLLNADRSRQIGHVVFEPGSYDLVTPRGFPDKTSCSVAASHNLIVLLALLIVSRFPSGEKATDRTASECPLRVSSSWPVAVSHSLTVRSSLPLASRFPSGEKATDRTKPECPLRVSSSWPEAASHSLTVRSPLPVASRFPSGERATEETRSECPLRVRNSWPVAASRSLT